METSKISRTIGVMNRLKNIIPLQILITLYNTMILPQLQYGILAWGLHTERLYTLQKKALRIITNNHFIAHTTPLFKKLSILRIDDMYELYVLKFYYKLSHNQLPPYFELFHFEKNNQINIHNLRPRILQLPRVKHAFATKCLKYQLHWVVRNADDSVLNKINTHSIKGYSWYIKQQFTTNYNPTCNIRFCYVCRLTIH